MRPRKGSSAVPPFFLGRSENYGVLWRHWQPFLGSRKVILIYEIRIQGLRFLNKIVTTSWSWESVDLVRGPREGQIAPRPKITCVF